MTGRSPALHLAAAMMLSSGLAACGDGRLPEHELAGATMGTTFSIKLVAPREEPDLDALQTAVDARLDRFLEVTSNYRDDSDLTRFNDSWSTDWIATSPELCDIVDAALALSVETGGAFDVTVGPLVDLWGFGPAGPVSEPPDPARIAATLARTGHARLAADCTIPALRKAVPDLHVDLSAYAKGRAVDELASLLETHGLGNYLVEIGGELFAKGINASGGDWSIAIERPAIERPDTTGRSVQSVAHLTDVGLATSGDYRNYFEHAGRRYSHTIDPVTGRPVEHDAASVTVVADSTAYADAMATALLVMGPVKGLEFANRNDVAALFLVRAGDDIEECMSDRFAADVGR